MTDKTIANIVRQDGQVRRRRRARRSWRRCPATAHHAGGGRRGGARTGGDEAATLNGQAVVLDGGERWHELRHHQSPRPSPAGGSNGLLAPAGGGCCSWRDRRRGRLGQVPRSGFAAQFRQALANVLEVVARRRRPPEDVGRMTVYVTDSRLSRQRGPSWPASGRELMGRHYPAMALVEVKALVDPHALVEIEATAVIIIRTGGWYDHRPESFLYALDPDTGVATITLNRPERLNALTFEVYASCATRSARSTPSPASRRGGDHRRGPRLLLGRRRRGHHRRRCSAATRPASRSSPG